MKHTFDHINSMPGEIEPQIAELMVGDLTQFTTPESAELCVGGLAARLEARDARKGITGGDYVTGATDLIYFHAGSYVGGGNGAYQEVATLMEPFYAASQKLQQQRHL